MQLLVHQFRDEVGQSDVDLHTVSKWAVSKGYLKLPKPVEPFDVLAKEFAKALREETKLDRETHRPYRVNHARMETRDGKQIALWGDIDRLERDPMLKSFVQRRQQMVGDAVQLSDDVDHWNRVNSRSEPIEIPFDFAPDIKWSKNAPGVVAS
jgi:hypothetical protein